MEEYGLSSKSSIEIKRRWKRMIREEGTREKWCLLTTNGSQHVEWRRRIKWLCVIEAIETNLKSYKLRVTCSTLAAPHEVRFREFLINSSSPTIKFHYVVPWEESNANIGTEESLWKNCCLLYSEKGTYLDEIRPVLFG